MFCLGERSRKGKLREVNVIHKQASDFPYKIVNCVLKLSDFSCVLKQKRSPGSSLSVPGQQLQETVMDQGGRAGLW